MRTPKHFKKWFEAWPQLVCFDLDGTLVDSVPDIALAVDSFLVEQGQAPVGEDQVRQWVGQGAASLVKKAMSDAGLDDALYEDCYRSFLLAYKSNLTQKTRLYANVLDLLKALKANHVPMALITNKPSAFVKPILDHFEISDYFSWILGADTLEEKKPSPLPLLFCAEAIEAQKDQCVMIGDSQTDSRAAISAGFKNVLVTYGYNQNVDLKSLEADLLIDDLVELLL
ncbi:MAG: phosphoglycolate phosphatase [Marinomonas sp.]